MLTDRSTTGATTTSRRDAEFVAIVDRDRPGMQGFVYLLLDDPTEADAVLDSVLAHLYATPFPPDLLRTEALRRLLRTDARAARLPWSGAAAFELVDSGPTPDRAPILDDLRRLTRDQRAAIVLHAYLELSPGQIAEVTSRAVEEVLESSRQARAALADGHPERDDEALARELRAAVPPDHRLSRGGGQDLTHGRRLTRRRSLRRAAIALVALLAVVTLGLQLRPAARPTPQTTAPLITGPAVTSPASPRPRATCDTRQRSCQTDVGQDWRSRMVAATGSHLDPRERYFDRYGFSDADQPAQSLRGSRQARDEDLAQGFWSGQGGALALDMSRSDASTEVSLQIATSSEFALTCGRATGTTCTSMRFMDGNRFTLSDSTDVRRGIEVQFSPDGQQVITVVARNRGHGPELDLSRATLLELAQDHRLRLPDL